MKVCLILHKYGVSLHDPCCYPLGFMYVSSYLKAMGHEVKILNYNLWDYDLQEELKGQDIAAFTGFEEFKPYILRDESICRSLGINTILGGALSTFNGIPEFCGLQHIGEIEKDESKSIDYFPYPDYDGFGVDEYHKRHFLRYMGVLTGRGCPYSCSFCAQTCQFKLRNLDYVFEEVAFYIKKYKIEYVVFNDNTLNINKPRFMNICKRVTIPWSAAIRCQPFDEEMARAASDSGCKYLVVGVESFNQSKLDRMNKKIKVRQIIKTLNILNKYKIDYHGNILVGFDDETTPEIISEVNSIPSKYKLFPAMVQPFIGTKEGKTRSISNDDYHGLNNAFVAYIQSKGKTCYPQLEL